VIVIKNSKLFPCYSIPLRDFLSSKGIRYEIVGINPTTHNMFWVYIKNNQLTIALDEWKKHHQ
jgi:hypothetical protein